MKSTLVDCYIEEFRSIVHWNTDGDDGLIEEQGEELIDYYYRRRYKFLDIATKSEAVRTL